jgi:hypothetical protein
VKKPVPSRVEHDANRLWPFPKPVTSVYVAASIHDRGKALNLAYKLLKAGVQVTSSWIDCELYDGAKPGRVAATGESRTIWTPWAKYCVERCDANLLDIDAADTMIILTDNDSSAGGRHVELGYAIAREHNILLVGRRENPFCFHDSIRVAKDEKVALDFVLAELARERHYHATVRSISEDVQAAAGLPLEDQANYVRDVDEFLSKFQCTLGIPVGVDGELPDDVADFRSKFLHEELHEYLSAVGDKFDAAKALDSLVDLVYVAVGNARFHRFGLWHDWQTAYVYSCMNRCRIYEHTRSNKLDLIQEIAQLNPLDQLTTAQTSAWLLNVDRLEKLLEEGDNYGFGEQGDPALARFQLSKNYQRQINASLKNAVQSYRDALENYGSADLRLALVSIVYVALQAALKHGFPFNQAWNLVHAANMQKERVLSVEDSAATTGRASKYDVKKPAGWKAPDIEGLLNKYRG